MMTVTVRPLETKGMVQVSTQFGNGFRHDHFMTWHELFDCLKSDTRVVNVILR